ncbi:MFS transporter [Desulfosporosinus sp. SYSU MS00001]|uniref:MFS transporter n=1 Tax=Desulfosporosinus sp. SYSU MS00001 TaxID=3416284 RepID=UPI003CEDE577
MSDIAKQTLTKVKYKILPFAFILYIVNIIDRVNLGFAALEMNKALHISSAAYGSLSAAYFITFLIFEVPSNILLHRIGTNKWIARIMVTWGMITSLTFFAQNFTHVYLLRFLLGMAEAGFFPGIIYYFTYWFPAKERAWATSLFMVASPISNIVGAPLATYVLDHIHWLGYAGWRWLFVIEGIPAVLLGVVTYFYMTNKPEDAKWLTSDEKKWLTQTLQAEQHQNRVQSYSAAKVFVHFRVWHLVVIHITIQMMFQSVSFWMPTLVKEFSTTFSNTDIGFIMMLPGIAGAIAMPLWALHSDRTRERKYHIAIPMLVSAAGLALAGTSSSVAVKILGVVLNGMGNACFYGPFWSVPATFLTTEGAAVGVAIINSSSSIGGFFGNKLVGIINGSSLGINGVLGFLIACSLAAFLLTLLLKLNERKSTNTTNE